MLSVLRSGRLGAGNRYAAAVRRGVEVGLPRGVVERTEQAADKVKVDAAYQVRVVLRQAVEGAIGERDAGRARVGLVAVVVEYVADRARHRGPTGTRPGGLGGVLAELGAVGDRCLVQCVGQRCAGLCDGGDCLRHDAAGEVVMPLGQGDRDVARGAAVVLGRTSRTWSCPAGRAAVVDLKKTIVFESVEMELRDVVRAADSSGGLLAADRLRLSDPVAVQHAADRPP